MKPKGKTRLEAVRAALTAAGVDEPTRSSLTTTYDLTKGSPALRLFYERMLANNLTEVYSEEWPTDEVELGDGADYRDVSAHGQAGVFQVDGALAVVVLENGTARLSIAAANRDSIVNAVGSFRSRYPFAAAPSDDLVPITFWSYGRFGPQSYTRRLAVSPWDQIEGNYTAEVRDGLASLMDGFEPGKGGQLLLWQGPPGTGKTWALRALASEWREWAEIHYVADPDAFFGEHAGEYMVEVLLREALEYPDTEGAEPTEPVERWRLLVLEDTGELLSADAKEKSGQALSRLLNVVDGLIGQGLRVLVLVTTNDSIETFHPAVSRPGRCASAIAFAPLTAEEVAARTGDKDAQPATLAELYAQQGEPVDPTLSSDDPGGDVKPEPATITADASGATDLPLSDRDHAWDASEAQATLETDQHADAHFWKDAELPFAAVIDGTLTAVWAGVEAAAQALADADIPEGDLAAVQSKIGAYYDRAAEQYDDDSIVPPWDEEGADAATTEALAELASRANGQLADSLGIPTPSDVRPAQNPEAEVELPEQRTNASEVRWEGILIVEDTLTEDGRYIKPGATTWRELPLSLAAMLETEEGHNGAEVCGRIDEIWREGNLIMGRGVFNDDEFGHKIGDMVESKALRGNSVDLAIREFELAPRSDFDESGHRIRETDEEVDMIELLMDGEDLVFVFLDCIIGMSTVCPFPAFGDANISVQASALQWTATRQQTFTVTRLVAIAPDEAPLEPEAPVEEPAPVESLDGLTASAAVLAPLKPPAEWFTDPQFEELTPLSVTDDGRVFGHFAQWDTCHIGIPDVCTTAPASMTQYAYFHLGEIETEEGSRVSCGHITLGMPHAAKHLGRQAATEHYDNTEAVVAFVVAGEDAHGPWISGALRSDIAPERIRDLRAAVLSGDWRNVNGNLELVGLLAVNVPGFPVPRSERALVAATESGLRVESLVAAGVVTHELTKAQKDKLGHLALVAESGLPALAAAAGADIAA